MMLWSRIYLLVLALSPLSRGHNETVTPPVIKNQAEQTGSSNITATTPRITVTPTNTSEERMEQTSPGNMDQTTLTRESEDEDYSTTEDANDSTAAQMTTAGGEPGATEEGGNAVVTTTAPVTSASGAMSGEHVEKAHSSGGYVILVIIVLVIIALCVILYLLRRSSRTYSFDLQRPLHVNHRDEPTGTFEPVHLDDLEPPTECENGTTDDLSPSPVVNGTTTPQTEENGSNGFSEQQDVNGLETLSVSNAGPSMSDQPVGTTPSPLDSTNLLCDAAGEEQQNENNNHPLCSDDSFVNINIDEPTWSDLPLS